MEQEYSDISAVAQRLLASLGIKNMISNPIVSSATKKKKSSVTDPNYSKVSASQVQAISRKDSIADILAKSYNLMRKDYEIYLKNVKKNKKYRKETEEEKEKNDKELISIFGAKEKDKKLIDNSTGASKLLSYGLLFGLGMAYTKDLFAKMLPSIPDFIKEIFGRKTGGESGFAKFPTMEAGKKAQESLWNKTYSNMPINDALKKWTATDENSQNFKNYKSILYAAVNKVSPVSEEQFDSMSYGQLSQPQQQAFLEAQGRAEGVDKPGSLPNRLNNPGALKYAGWEKSFGAVPTVDSEPKKLGSNITGRFGESRGDHTHGGIDLAGKLGDPVFATKSGKVTASGWEDPKNKKKGYGAYVEVTHDDNTKTRYAHLQEGSNISVGTQVDTGQKIGQIGVTGRSSGPHLHYEVFENGGKVDPEKSMVSQVSPLDRNLKLDKVTSASGVNLSLFNNNVNIRKGDEIYSADSATRESSPFFDKQFNYAK
jgi:murein DD-endopeptidase MepM/ murein hydrolase activator NlpD